MILLTTLLSLILIYSIANWEAQAFAKGSSNHFFKWIGFISTSLMFWCFYKEPDFKHFLLSLSVFPLLYLALFDYILNFARKVDYPMSYKLCCHWMFKVLALICMSIIIGVYFYESK